MIVFGWRVFGPLDPERSRHAKMNTQPVVIRELEEHSFSAGDRVHQFLTDDPPLQISRVRSAKDPLSRVQQDSLNPRVEARIPLFTMPFNLSQLRHAADYARSGDRQSPGRAFRPCPAC